MEITDPTLVFLLVTLGLVGLGVESLTPGGFFPAIVGLIALILGVIGLVDVGPTAVGMGLLFLSIASFVAAVALKLYRPLSAVGSIALIAAGIWMFDRSTDPTSIPAVVIAGIVVGAFMSFVIERASRVKTQPVRYGPEDLVGMTGDVRSPMRPGGQVFIDGALWGAELEGPGDTLATGERIEVVEVRGLTLVVRPYVKPETKLESGGSPEEGEAV
ncbi:MAG: hypothetical protein M3Y45_02950 [Actinomycetota bacterium]|nr:hypothetical protein [Actinomycetota bacterium]